MRRSAWRRAAACVACCGRETQGRQMQRAADCEVLLCTTAVHDPVSITTSRYAPRMTTAWLSCGFTSHSTQNRSFWRHFPKPIFWLGMKKTKPDTTKAHIHQSKEMYYNTKWTQKTKPRFSRLLWHPATHPRDHSHLCSLKCHLTQDGGCVAFS